MNYKRKRLFFVIIISGNVAYSGNYGIIENIGSNEYLKVLLTRTSPVVHWRYYRDFAPSVIQMLSDI